MRITKKYAGESSLGKKVFNLRSELYTPSELQQLSELALLEQQYHQRVLTKHGQSMMSKGYRVVSAASAAGNDDDESVPENNHFDSSRVPNISNNHLLLSSSMKRVMSEPNLHWLGTTQVHFRKSGVKVASGAAHQPLLVSGSVAEGV
jgi:hypothetical protein